MNTDKLMAFDYDKWGWFDLNDSNKRLPAKDLGKWFPFTKNGRGKTRYLNAGHAEIIYDANPQLVISAREPVPEGYCPTHGKKATADRDGVVIQTYPPIYVLRCPMCEWEYHKQEEIRGLPISDDYL